jgi:hypothetical protein
MERTDNPAGSIAAVEKSCCVKGKLDVGSTRGDLIKLAVRQRYGIFGTRRADRSQSAKRYKTKELTPHRTLHNKRWGLFQRIAMRFAFLVSPYFLQQTAHES